MSTVKFNSNIELAQKYRTIQLKPRKYEDKDLIYSDRDFILPYFNINLDNSERSTKQMDDYNNNEFEAKK